MSDTVVAAQKLSGLLDPSAQAALLTSAGQDDMAAVHYLAGKVAINDAARPGKHTCTEKQTVSVIQCNASDFEAAGVPNAQNISGTRPIWPTSHPTAGQPAEAPMVTYLACPGAYCATGQPRPRTL